MANTPAEMVLELQPDTWEEHWRRIRAWSVELARVRGLEIVLPPDPLLAVFEGPKGSEFLADSGITVANTGNTQQSRKVPRASDLLELAHALEDHLAWEPFQDGSSEIDPFAQTAIESLRCVTKSDLDSAMGRLPVFPAAAQRALQMLATENWNAANIESIASSDQVLAADLIRASNSCVLGCRRPITTLGHAIAYLGAERATSVLVAARVKRLFAPQRLREIWNHSLDAAETARSLARLAKQGNPEEAFLAGLVHDIGRLAMALLPQSFQTRSTYLMGAGCELAQVEKVLCGATHAEIGADALERWRFPAPLVEAVRFHHRPEQTLSPLAAVLYLMERCTNPNECLASLSRSKAALERLRLTEGLELAPDAHPALQSLRFSE